MTKKKPNTPNMSRKNSSGNEFNDKGKSSKFNKGSKKNFKKQKGGNKKDHFFNFNASGSKGRDDDFSFNNSPFSNDDTLFQLPKGKNIKKSLLNDDDSDYGFGMGRSDRGENSNNKRRKTNSSNNRKMGKSEAFNSSPRFGNSSQDNWSTKGRSTRESDNLENQPWITKPLAFINLSSSKSYFEEELSQLIEFLKPTEKELIARAWVIEQVSTILEKMYDNSKCLPFGSFTTQLLLPGSDVDLVLLADSLKDKKALKSALYKMKDVIKRNGLLSKCEVVPGARIPLIKFTEPLTRVKVDICLNTITGLDSSKFTLQYSEEYPQLKWLTVVIKLLLDRLNLNDPAIGGMGGYAIFLLGLSLIQVHDLKHLNLCDLLIRFLEYYGMIFDHKTYGIDFKVPGHYFSKRTSHLRLSFKDSVHYNRQLIIVDPNQENNIVSKATSKFDKIQSYFKLYFLQLSEKLDEINWKLNNPRLNQNSDKEKVRIYSILKHWIKFDRFELNQREHLNRVNIKNTQTCKKWIINSTDNFSSAINTNELSSVRQ
jgi:DNA polymerase sigma